MEVSNSVNFKLKLTKLAADLNYLLSGLLKIIIMIKKLKTEILRKKRI